MRGARGAASALLLSAGIGMVVAMPASAASRADLDALSQKVDRVESVRDVKVVQRTFAQLAQFGEFKQMASLFAANGTLQWGDQTVTGRKAIQSWLTTDAGAMDGIKPGSMNTTMIDNPIVNLSADGHTAQGRF